MKRIEIEDEEEVVLVHDDPRRFSERKYMEDQIRKEKQATEKALNPYDGERLKDDGYDTSQDNSEENLAKKKAEEVDSQEQYQEEYTGGSE